MNNTKFPKSIKKYDCIGPCYEPNTPILHPITLEHVYDSTYPFCPINEPNAIIDGELQLIDRCHNVWCSTECCFLFAVVKGTFKVGRTRSPPHSIASCLHGQWCLFSVVIAACVPDRAVAFKQESITPSCSQPPVVFPRHHTMLSDLRIESQALKHSRRAGRGGVDCCCRPAQVLIIVFFWLCLPSFFFFFLFFSFFFF